MDKSILIVVLTFIASAVLTGFGRKIIMSRGMLDIPNSRSSHTSPIPRGGGISIVITVTVAALLLMWLQIALKDIVFVLVIGGAAVAIVGFLDDQRRLPVSIRLAVHIGAAVFALAYFGGLPPLRVARKIITFGWAGYVLGTIGIVWFLNLFNFMDGIDGIAASEAIFMCCGGAMAIAAMGQSAGMSALCLVVGAACSGFLLWNWPPAKIFMGDVGSGYMGYVLSILALGASYDHPVTLWVWFILGAVFIVDATVTLIGRLSRGQSAHQAHRSHTYQLLARRWGSHRRVTTIVIIVDVVWLLPSAILAATFPSWAVWIAGAAVFPIAAFTVKAGAGRSE